MAYDDDEVKSADSRRVSVLEEELARQNKLIYELTDAVNEFLINCQPLMSQQVPQQMPELEAGSPTPTPRSAVVTALDSHNDRLLKLLKKVRLCGGMLEV